jgi:hypothetical protein
MRRGPYATPGRFRTRLITDGVTPRLHVGYKDVGQQAGPSGPVRSTADTPPHTAAETAPLVR